MNKSIVIVSDRYAVDFFNRFLEEVKAELYLEFPEEANKNQELNETNAKTETQDRIIQVYNKLINDYELIKQKPDTKTVRYLTEIANQFFPNRKSLRLIEHDNQNNFDYVSIFSNFYLQKILNFWELVILETPLLIQCDTPAQSSRTVLALESLIEPLVYVGDVRPYFTIYDEDFKRYASSITNQDDKILEKNGPIFGVINPILIKTFSSMAVVHFDDIYFNEMKMINLTTSPEKTPKDKRAKQLPIAQNLKNKNFYLKISDAFLKILQTEMDSARLNIYIKLYLDELNNDFIRTFEDYFFLEESSQMRRISFFKAKISIFEIFKPEKFLKYLSCNDVYFNKKYINDRKRTLEFYSKFIETKCFLRFLEKIL